MCDNALSQDFPEMVGVDDAESLNCRGFCADCGLEHEISAAPALDAAHALMADLTQRGNIGLGQDKNPLLGLDYLFGPARGQMFGVLVYQNPDKTQGVLKAFSGQYNGIWNVQGWVPPIVEPEKFLFVTSADEARIKKLTRKIENLPISDVTRKALVNERRILSRELMARIFALYRLENFRGQSRQLSDAFIGNGLPTGTGECCAPKLLHHAARLGLRPLGLAEFYLGRGNRSGTRQNGHFYAPCAEKCRPILGFLLCGLDAAK